MVHTTCKMLGYDSLDFDRFQVAEITERFLREKFAPEMP